MLYFNSNKPHSFVFCFFCRIRVVLENRRSFQGGVRTPCTLPLDPPLLLQTKITKSSLQVSKQVNAPPVHFVCFFFSKVCKFDKLCTRNEDSSTVSSDFATYLFYTPTAFCHCCWCPIFLLLVCHTVCQLTLRNVQVFLHVLS